MKKLKKTTKNKSINSVAEKFTIKAKPAVAFATAGFFQKIIRYVNQDFHIIIDLQCLQHIFVLFQQIYYDNI